MSEPRLTEQISKIHMTCPTLLTDLLPYSELGTLEDNDGQNQMAIMGDTAHEKPLALTCLDRGYVRKELRWPLWPGELALNDPFSLLLQRAYETDYGEPNVVPPRRVALQWCQKLSFTDR